MNQKRNNRRKRNNENKKQKKVIRCQNLNRPVFEHEICDKFISKINSNSHNTCENCKHSN